MNVTFKVEQYGHIWDEWMCLVLKPSMLFGVPLNSEKSFICYLHPVFDVLCVVALFFFAAVLYPKALNQENVHSLPSYSTFALK